MWLLPLSFFAFQFILRVCTAVFMQDIMHKFHINALSYGILASFYYVGYAGLQIPLGMLLDKYNPRYVISGSIFICAIGAFLFASTDNWYVLLMSRFLIGAGSAIAFLGTAKIIRLCFKREHYSIMVGFSFTIGLIGAIFGGKPLAIVTENYGWEQVTLMLSVITFAIAALILLCMRLNNYDYKNIEQSSPLLPQIMSILKNKKLLLIGLCGGLMVGSLEGFADVWGVTYLTQIYDIPKKEASYAVSLIFFGMCVGGPLLSFLGERFKSNYFLTLFCAIVMSILFILLIYGKKIEFNMLQIMFFFVGILCCYQVVIFTIVSELVPPNLIGIATAITNTINMAFGIAFHSSIGYMMDLYWTGKMIDGVKIYEKIAFNYALSVIPIAALLGFIGLIFTKNNNKLVTNTI
jgi:MFS family permease